MKIHFLPKPLFIACMAAACLFVAVAHAACPSFSDRFTAIGAEVVDRQTGLIWERCSAGQSWSGSTCTGSVASYTHEAALAYAQTQNRANNAAGWRLPNVKELASLVDRGCRNPAIDSAAFPGMPPSEPYWSSSPDAADPSDAWSVFFDLGRVYNEPRTSRYHVRLVRASQ